MGLRRTLACAAGRFCSWFLRAVAHRSASQLPGRIALGIDRNLIYDQAKRLSRGSVVICGTNGKTTTNNVVASSAEAAGFRIACNRAGANMAAGVATALLPLGHVDWAIIEADELSTIRILPQLRPQYLVLLNLFRDQLDRAGEIDRVQDTIVKALSSSPQTELVVCGDDPLSMGVAYRAKQAGTHVITFGIGEDLHLPADRVPEARFCQVCGTELTYEYRSYAQLGAFRCPKGDFSRPSLDFVATGVEVGRAGVSFDVTEIVSKGTKDASSADKVHLSASFGGVYMVYNLMAAFAAAHLMGISATVFQGVLDCYHPANGRLQHFEVDGREVVLNLAKNPTGFNQNISLLMADGRPKSVFIVVNDDFNDGKDISWIWDVDFERLSESKPKLHVIVGGHRANDLQLRFKYAGLSAPIADSVGEALRIVGNTDVGAPLYVLTNYSALRPAKIELERLGRRHE